MHTKKIHNALVVSTIALTLAGVGGLSSASVFASDGGTQSAITRNAHHKSHTLHLIFLNKKGKEIANPVDLKYHEGEKYSIHTLPIERYVLEETKGSPVGIMGNTNKTITYIYEKIGKHHRILKKSQKGSFEEPLKRNSLLRAVNNTSENDEISSNVTSNPDNPPKDSESSIETSSGESVSSVSSSPVNEENSDESSSKPDDTIASDGLVDSAVQDPAGTANGDVDDTSIDPFTEESSDPDSNITSGEDEPIIKPTPLKPTPLPQTGRQKASILTFSGIGIIGVTLIVGHIIYKRKKLI